MASPIIRRTLFHRKNIVKTVSGARNASSFNTMSTVVEFVITPLVGAFALTKLLMATTCKELEKTPSCDENQKVMNNYENAVLGKNTE